MPNPLTLHVPAEWVDALRVSLSESWDRARDWERAVATWPVGTPERAARQAAAAQAARDRVATYAALMGLVNRARRATVLR